MIRTFSNIVCAAGDIRNDLYLTLERGDFERGGKSVQKNIEVTVFVLYADGEILKVPAETETFSSGSRMFPPGSAVDFSALMSDISYQRAFMWLHYSASVQQYKPKFPGCYRSLYSDC